MSTKVVSIKANQIAGMNVHYFYYPFEYFLDVQQRLGCESIELWGGTPHVWVDHISYFDCKMMNQQVEKRDQKIVMFTPESSSLRYSLCASDPDRHKKTMEYFKKCIQVTSELGSSYMCINALGKYEEEDYQTAWRRCTESVHILCEAAKKEGVTIGMETLCQEQSSIITSLSELKRLFSEVNSNHLKAVLDIVSAVSAGETIDQWFDALGESIVHSHFVDGRNTGTRYIWGDGCYPIERFIGTLNKHGYTGCLGQELTAKTYFEDPAEADLKNMNILRKYVKDS